MGAIRRTRMSTLGYPSSGTTIMRQEVLKELHSEHLGICRIKELSRSLISWPGLHADLAQLTRNCPICSITPWKGVDIDFAQFKSDY